MLAQMLYGIMFFVSKLVTVSSPNNACSGLGGMHREKGRVLARSFFRFDGWFSHQATNARR
jgi:hypothetical protein